jgi:predicted  nucleic acid-binding Zn-ribbon protein
MPGFRYRSTLALPSIRKQSLSVVVAAALCCVHVPATASVVKSAQENVSNMVQSAQKNMSNIFRNTQSNLTSILAGDAAQYSPETQNRSHLEYKNVIYKYFTTNFLESLTEQAYLEYHGNEYALSLDGQLLDGGMSLSFGMADDANQLFDSLLSQYDDQVISNRIYYYLSNYDYYDANPVSARRRIEMVEGDLPDHLKVDYLYLSSLVQNPDPDYQKRLSKVGRSIDDDPRSLYIKFNNAVSLYGNKQYSEAITILSSLANYSGQDEERMLLGERARHAMALIVLEQGDYNKAWRYLEKLNVSGLYSNRSLLTYAWTAIKLKKFDSAINALVALTQRSIASPEVQEALVLLAHVYEEQGQHKKSLNAYTLAIQTYESGIKNIQTVDRYVTSMNVPRKFIDNLQQVSGQIDRFSTGIRTNEQTLNPYVLDLVASHKFHRVLMDLTDLYTIKDNLSFWEGQIAQLGVVLEQTKGKKLSGQARQTVNKTINRMDALLQKHSELKLESLSLNVKDQKRVDVLLNATADQLKMLADSGDRIQGLNAAYNHPDSFAGRLAKIEQRRKALYQKNVALIRALEPVLLKLLTDELKTHSDRMTYYIGQSRLGRVRLLDKSLKLKKGEQNGE